MGARPTIGHIPEAVIRFSGTYNQIVSEILPKYASMELIIANRHKTYIYIHTFKKKLLNKKIKIYITSKKNKYYFFSIQTLISNISYI